MAVSVLIVEDDRNIAELLQMYLEKEGYAVTVAADGAQGLSKFRAINPDLVLLDVMMPVMSGLQMLSALRESPETVDVPVIMLSARQEVEAKVEGFSIGANDYLAKPFSPRELLARLRAVLRRAQPSAMAEKLEAHGVSVDVPAREARVNGRRVELTGLEFDLLVALVRRAGRVIPRDALLGEAGRGDTLVGERTVDVHISHLRQKLGEEGARLIKTVRGVGYLFAREGP